jgi:hypothetical protein
MFPPACLLPVVIRLGKRLLSSLVCRLSLTPLPPSDRWQEMLSCAPLEGRYQGLIQQKKGQPGNMVVNAMLYKPGTRGLGGVSIAGR